MSQRTPSHWTRDATELAHHRLLEGRVAVVQLEGVRPAVEVGVAPIRQHANALGRLDAAVVLRLSGDLLFRPRHEEVRVPGHPGVVRRHVVRDEVEDEAQAPALQASAEPGERLVPAEVLVDAVVTDREAGAADVLLAEVGQDAPVLGKPLSPRARDVPGRRAGLPHAEEPDKVEPVRGQPVDIRIGEVVEGRLPAQLGRELREPDPRVDLEERGIPRRGHSPLLAAHLLADDAGLELPLGRLQRVLGRHAPEGIQKTRDEPGPARLVTGPEAGADVAVEVLVEEDQVAPVRVVLELRRAAVDRPATGRVRRNMLESRREISFATSKRVIRFPEPVGHSTLRSSP